MSEVVYYAFPYFILLLILEALAFKYLGDDDGGLIGYDARDTRTSLLLGVGNVVINFGWKLVVLALYVVIYEATPLSRRSR